MARASRFSLEVRDRAVQRSRAMGEVQWASRSDRAVSGRFARNVAPRRRCKTDGGHPPTTASTPDRTCKYVRCHHAPPSSGSDGAYRRRRFFPSRNARSTAHRGSLAGTSWGWPLGARGSWRVSSCGPYSAIAPPRARGCASRTKRRAWRAAARHRPPDCRVNAHTAHLPSGRTRRLRPAGVVTAHRAPQGARVVFRDISSLARR